MKGGSADSALRRLATGGGLFTDGDWVETPFITDSGVRLIQTGNVGVGRYREQGHRYISHESFRLLRCTEVLPGDLLISRLADPVGRSCIAPDLGVSMITSVDVAILRPRPGAADTRYLNYYMSSSRHLDAVAAISRGGTRERISREQLGAVSVRVPPLDEQRSIADYLDYETERIDALISAKQQMLTLISEQFDSTVFGAVTGRAHSGDVRVSGLSWVGDIPATWGCPPIAANFTVQLGKMLNVDAAAGPEQRPYLRNTDVQWFKINTVGLPTMHFDGEDRLRFSLRPGDLLVCEGGEVGRAAIWNGAADGDFFFQKALHRVRPLRGSNPAFLLYCLRAASTLGVFRVEGNLSTIPHLTREQLLAHRFPWPPPSEQVAIVEELDELRARTEAIARKLRRQVELLREHRSSLITEALAGNVTTRLRHDVDH